MSWVRRGRLIAHPDISLVLRQHRHVEAVDRCRLRCRTGGLGRNTASTGGASVAGRTRRAAPATAASADCSRETGLAEGALNIQGQEVLTRRRRFAPLGWIMFVELPVKEAYASL